MGRKTLDQWIFDAISDPDKDAPIRMLSLVHRAGGFGEVEVHTFKFSPTSNGEPKRLAEVFLGKADSYCQDFHGVQTFNLLAFYGDSTEPGARQPFTRNVQTDAQTSGLYTEPPTSEGLTQQGMRHREQAYQQVYNKQTHLDNYTLRLLELEGTRNNSLATENREMFSIMKEMMMQQALDRHNRTMQALEFQRATEERAKLIKMAPPLINTITGQEIFPQATEDTALVEMISNVLTDKHLGKLMELGLPDAVMGALAARVIKAKEKKEAEEKHASQLAVYQGSGEDDIVGGRS